MRHVRKTWRVSDMRHRIQVRKGVQTPNASGGFDRTYKIKATIWASCTPLSFTRQGKSTGTKEGYIRGQQIEEKPTHEFVMRRQTHMGIDFAGSSYLLKNDHFLFKQAANDERIGRSFHIMGVENISEQNAFIMVIAKEIETQEVTGLVV